MLHFPRVISRPDLYTGIAIGNPTGSQAVVTFTAFHPDGTALAGGARNPVTVIIPAAGQFARLFPEIFGVGSFNGWVQVSSVTPGLTGFALNGNTNLMDLDGTGSVSPGVEVILPLAAEDAITRTEVTVVNPNSEVSAVSLSLYASNGFTLSTRDLTIPARGLERRTLGSLFGSIDFSSGSHIRVRADRPVLAQEVVSDFQLPGTALRRESAALSGHTPSAGKTAIIPQFATGGEWLSLIGLVNASSLAQDVTLTAYLENGSLWQVPSNPRRITLSGNAGFRGTVGELFGFPADRLSTGWIQVTSSQGFVTAYTGYGNSQAPSFAMVEATPAEEASRYSVFSHVAEAAGFYTGLTVVNPGTEIADIEFYTVRADGSTVGRATFSIGPNQKLARLFRELLPASLEQLGGWGFVRSSRPVVGAVLFGSSNYALANVPQQLPAGDFIPPAQTTAAITGTVRSAGVGIPGVQVALSGPVNTVRTTDDAGRYTFTHLPAGPYKVAVSRAGASFIPSERTVSLDRQNADGVDFNASGIVPANVPVLTSVTPAVVFAASGALTVHVFGSEFTPYSYVRFNQQLLPTTFVSSRELTAAVAEGILAQPATLQVTVETLPPGGGRSAPLSFIVTSIPTDPLVAGRAGVGSFPAGVAIDQTRHRALVTNQSADSVTVLDLTTLQVVAEIRVGRNPAEGIDIHSAKDIALVANPGSNDVSVIDLRTNTVIRTIAVGKFPIGLAINSVTNRAYVVNGEEDSVSVISLDTFAVIGQIAVGSRPSNVAVNPRTNQAVVSNRAGNSVTVIDLTTGAALATVPVNELPRGVAIDPESNRAAVVNANNNSVSILNLNTRTVEGTVNVGPGPTAAAIHVGTGTVVVTNSGMTQSAPGSGASSASVIDLSRREVIATVPVGTSAFGVGVDEERQIAVVANFGSNDVTLVRIPNPLPHLTDADPKTFSVGADGVTITVRGTGFVRSSVITLDSQPLPTVFVSRTELRGTILAGLLQAVELTVGVQSPPPGGGANPAAESVTIRVLNAAPVLLSLSPTEIEANTTDLTLTLSGTNFNATSIVNFGGRQFSPSSVSLSSMTVIIPRSELVAGSIEVTVTNPAPGGGTSAALPFRVNGQTNPPPSVTSVDPGSIPVGAGSMIVVVKGAGFISSTTATLAGIAGSLSGDTVSFALPAAQTEKAATLSGLIVNPGPGGGTAAFFVNVLNPVPTIGTFTPATAEAGTSSVSIQVNGGNFRSDSQITMAGIPIPTTFSSQTQLIGTVPSSLLASIGELRVGVTNPAPGGGSVEGGVFRVTDGGPVITSVSPDRPRPGQTIRILGRTFRTDSIVSFRSAAIATAFVSSTELSATIPNPTAIGAGDLVVTNPAAGVNPALSSGSFTITIISPAPTLLTVSPNNGPSGANVLLTLTGVNFEAAAQVIFAGLPVTTTFLNPGTLQATVTLGLPGDVIVNASNPGGFVSNGLTFTVTGGAPPPPTNPVPAIVSVSPSIVAFGSPDQSITIDGSNFNSTTTATFASQPVTITNRTATTLLLAVPAALLSPGGNKSIAVTNPAPGGGTATTTLLANAFSLTPLQVDKSPSATQQFVTSGVSGTLIWSVNGIDGGNSTFGTISGAGFYTAPASIPTPAGFRVCARLSTDATFLACAAVTISAPVSTVQDLVVFNDSNPFDETQITDANNKLMVRNLVNFTGVGPRATGTVARFDCGRNSANAGACTSFTTMRSEIVAAGLTVSQSDSSSGSLTSIPANVKALFLWLPRIPFTPAEVNTLKNFALDGGRIVFIGESDTAYSQTGLDVENDLLIKMGAGMRNIGQAVNCGTTVLSASSLRPHQITTGMTQLTMNCSSVVTLGANDLPLFYDSSNTKVLAGTARIDTTVLPVNPPTINSITPNTGAAGSTVNVTIAGANFIAGSIPAYGTNVTIGGGNVTVSNINVVNSNSLTATLTIDLDASVTTRTATVTTPNGSVTGGSFNVTAPPAPQLTTISPSVGAQGATVSVTLTGTNFIPGLSSNVINLTGSGITTTVTNVISPTTIVADFVIAAGAPLGPRNVSVTTTGGTSTNVIAFTVNPPPPSLTSINPALGIVGAAVPVTLTGTNFTAGTTVAVSGTGVTVSGVNVVSGAVINATLTIAAGAAVGTRDVTVTTAGGTSNPAQFVVSSPFALMVFTGAISTNWSDPGNWSIVGTPDSTTGVLIPASAIRQPTLTANVSVLHLTVETGATLSTAGFTINVGGNVDGGSTITGTGTVVMSGNGTVQGSIPNLTVTGTAVFPLSTASTVTGNVTIQNTGILEIVGTVNVTGNLSTANTGKLKMTSAGAGLAVSGSSTFDGGDTSGLLTAGLLSVKGDFIAPGSLCTSFAASGTHKVVLNGTAAQGVSLACAGSTGNRFQDLDINNAAGVSLINPTQANGRVALNAGSISGAGGLTVAGSFTSAPGTTITPGSLSLGGAMSVAGTFSVPTVTFFGTNQTVQAGLGYQNVIVTGAALFGGATTISGNLTASGGTVDINGQTVTVTGTFTTTGGSGGKLKMPNAASALTVNGSATLDGGDTSALLQAGVLTVKGNFTTTASSCLNFAASGTHKVVLSGTVAQTVNVSCGGSANNRFQDLDINNPAGVVFVSAAQANGNLALNAGTISGAGSLTVGGNLNTAPTTSITISSFGLGGAMAVGGTFSPATTILSGSNQFIQPGLGYQNIVVTGTALFAGTTTVGGNLTASGSGIVDINGQAVTVNGALATTGGSAGGRLRMASAAGALSVNGAASFDGGNTTGLLTAGILTVKGSFSTTGSSCQSFAASSAHRVVLGGTAAQGVSFACAGNINNRFQDLQINNNAGVSFTNLVQVNGTVTVTAGAAVGSGPVIIAGNLVDPVGSRWQVAATTFSGSPNVLPSAMVTSATFTGTAVLPNDISVTGNLTVSGLGAVLDLNCKRFDVGGNFLTILGGALRMVGVDCNNYLVVVGNVTFDGGSTEGLLDQGTLEVRGNFTATSSSLTNFAPTHFFYVLMRGTAQQTITMAFPGLTQQRFRYLESENTVGVSMGSDIVVGEGLISATAGVREKIIGNDRTLTALNLIVDGLDLDNVLLVVNLADRFEFVNDLVFRNYADSATRLRITGDGNVHSFTNINFVQGVPVTGYLVNSTDSLPDASAFTLIIATNPNIPAVQAGPRTLTSQGAVVVWE